MLETLVMVAVFVAGILTQYLFSLIDKILFYVFKNRWEERKELHDWFNDVEQALNGVQHAWHYVGNTPSQADRKHTVQHVDTNIERLEEFRNDGTASPELRSAINNLSARWRDNRGDVLNSPSSARFDHIDELVDHEVDAVHEVVAGDRPSTRRERAKKAVLAWFQRAKASVMEYRSSYFPEGVRSRLEEHLSDDEIRKLYDGDRSLLVWQDSHTEIYEYNSDGTFTKYLFLIDLLSRPVSQSLGVSAGVTVDAEEVCAAIDDASRVKVVWGDIIEDGELNRAALYRTGGDGETSADGEQDEVSESDGTGENDGEASENAEREKETQ